MKINKKDIENIITNYELRNRTHTPIFYIHYRKWLKKCNITLQEAFNFIKNLDTNN